MRYIFILLTVLASSSYGQIGYRSATKDIEVKKNFEGLMLADIDCNTSMVSLVGRELYFPIFKQPVPYGDRRLVKGVSVDAASLKNPKAYNYRLEQTPQAMAMYQEVPYAAFENKTYKIIAATDAPAAAGFCTFSFTLQDEDNVVLHWDLHSRNVNMYPFYFKTDLAKLKNEYAGKKYYMRNNDRTDSFYNMLDNKHYKIETGKEYTCTDLSFLSSDALPFAMPFLIFRDATGKEISVYPQEQDKPMAAAINTFWTEAGYATYQQQEQQRLQAAAAQAQADQKAEEARQHEEAAHEQMLVKRYGRATAAKLMNGQVDLGMNMAMARESWGEPTSTTKTAVTGGVVETWHYGLLRWLKFKNGTVIQVSE